MKDNELKDVKAYVKMLAPVFPSRFGYFDLRDILLSYLSNSEADKNDYKKYVDEICKKRSVKAETVRDGISRFVKQGWKYECFRLYWKDLMGYDKENPPNAMTIIKLVCENYEPFMAEHKDLLYETGIYKGDYQFEKDV